MKTVLVIIVGIIILFVEIQYIIHYESPYKAVCRVGTAQLVQDTQTGDFEYLGPLEDGRMARTADTWCVDHDYKAVY